jgi:alkaline phosphatase
VKASKKLLVAYALTAVAVAFVTALPLQYLARADNEDDPDNGDDHSTQIGNVIFIHPDGSGLNHWNAARMYWEGPDGLLQWEQLPEMAVYRGHLLDRLTATSEGGATTHAFGHKVIGPDSFGEDGGRSILALSGFPGSIMREASHAGYPVGIVNDGDAAEPGTGAFLAEVNLRENANEIARQILKGRPGANDPEPMVVLGGGERFFLPEGTRRCTDTIEPDCAVHIDPVDGAGPARTDGRNLIQEAIDDGWGLYAPERSSTPCKPS